MRESISRVSSTGESLRLRKRRATSSIEAKARSVSVVGGTIRVGARKESNTEDQESTEARRRGGLKDFVLAAEIAEGSDVGNDEGGGETIFCADLAEVNAAVLKSEATAVSVVADLHELALQGVVGEIVAYAGGEVESFARQVAVAEEGADLVGEGLLEGDEAGRWRKGGIAFDGIVVEAEVGDGGEKFTVRFDFQERANRDETLDLRFVLEDLLQVVETAGGDLEIADDRRPVAWTESEGEWRDGVEGFEHISLAVRDSAAERRIEIVLLKNAPGEELLRLVVAGFGEQPLSDAVFDFVGVGESGVGIEADEVSEIVYAGDIAVGDRRFDGVLVPFVRLVFVERRAVEKALESGRAEFDGEFAGVAGDRLAAKLACRIVGIAVVGGAERGGCGDAEPGAEVQRHGDFGSEFDARDERRRVERSVILAMEGASKGIERKVEREIVPGGLLDGTEADLGSVAQRNADGRGG